MTERPSKGVDVDEDNANDTTSRRTSNVAVLSAGVGEADVEGEIKHSSGLHTGANKEGKSSSNTAAFCQRVID